ncbi:hypothetical protein Tco_0991637 [Tanacetum coccineum]|uniref:Uncharacterized protein n=1 Tax=Tanacetum coccineum TaxID=301880 RepID=A0ABQ5F0K5_9ASTR
MGEVRNMRIQIGTSGAVINMGGGTLSIDDGVIRHTYVPKPRAKAYLENFEIDEENHWFNKMERALAMEAYFNPFKNIIIFKKLIDFLGSLLVQLKNTDWGNEGYGMYKKIEGDGAWHAKFEVITPSGRNSLGIQDEGNQEEALRKVYFGGHSQVRLFP